MHDDFLTGPPYVLEDLALRPPETQSPAVIVGLAPARSGGPPWDPSAGSSRRLADLADCHPHELRRFFGLTNLVPSFDGDGVAYQVARRAAEKFAFVRGFRYILVGQVVCRAFGTRVLSEETDRSDSWTVAEAGPPCFRWYTSRAGVEMAAIPHPSGRNRWYNLAQRRVAAGRFLRAARWRGEGLAADLWDAALTRRSG